MLNKRYWTVLVFQLMGSAVYFHVESGMLQDITWYFSKSLEVVSERVLRIRMRKQEVPEGICMLRIFIINNL
jgi:hypothetical protein